MEVERDVPITDYVPWLDQKGEQKNGHACLSELIFSFPRLLDLAGIKRYRVELIC